MSVNWQDKQQPSESVDSHLRAYGRLKRTASQPEMNNDFLSDAFTWLGKALRAANPWAPTVTMALGVVLALAVYGAVCIVRGYTTGVWR